MADEEKTEDEILEEERKKYAYSFPERQKVREEKNKQPEIEKKAAEQQHYTVEVEAWARTTFKYKVIAESPEQAIELIDRSPLLQAPKPKTTGIRKISAKVYLLGSNMLKHMRNF